MASDSKNLTRLDLQDIYEQLKDVTHQALRGSGLSVEDYAISDNESQTVHRFMMRGMSHIANKTRRVKYYSQTGLDGISYYAVFEKPLDYDDANGNFTDPDGNTVAASAVYNLLQVHETGEKLNVSAGDTLIMEIDGLPDDQMRYTVVQEFIIEAIVEYVLFKWWEMKGQQDRAGIHRRNYEKALVSTRFNSVSNSQAKNTVIRSRPYG